jgi:NDP-sugar pyrophosphorylase family protein
MQIVIPMAGTGERFKRAGYKEPKPLIEVDGKPMIEHVVNLFPGEKNFLFICNQAHIDTSDLGMTLERIAPEGIVCAVDSAKKGPVYAITKAEHYMSDDEPVLVSYCDFSLVWDYKDFLRTIARRDPDSAAVCYTGFHPHLLNESVYAGVRADDKLHALEVREKFSFTQNKMDGWHQAGLFYFKNGSLLKKYAQRVVDEEIVANGEHFVSLIFNLMIADKLSSIVYPAPYFCQWGTPEDLRDYTMWMRIIERHDGKIPENAKASADARKIFEYWNSYRKHSKSL